MPKHASATRPVDHADLAPNVVDAADRAPSKLQTIIALLRRPDGAILDELVTATGWQKHSVRGAISGALKKKHKLDVSSTVVEGRGRIYRIEGDATASTGASSNNDHGVQS